MDVKRKKILRNLVSSAFWVIIFIGLFIACPDKNGSKIICALFIILNGISLWNNIWKYIEYPMKQKQVKYDKDMSDFKKRMDDLINNAKKRQQSQYQQQRQPVGTKVYDIKKSYQLMNLKLTDDIITIKKKYRELAKKYHPDKFAQDTYKSQEAANRNFQKLNEAYSIIKKYKNIT